MHILNPDTIKVATDKELEVGLIKAQPTTNGNIYANINSFEDTAFALLGKTISLYL